MNKFISIFFIFILSSGLLYAKEIKYKGKMGYLVEGLDDIKYKDARLAFGLWAKELSAGEGVETKIHYYDTVEAMTEDYKNYKIDYMTVNPYFLLKYQDIFYNYTKEFWTSRKTKEKFQEYFILVRADANIKSIKDLKGKTFMGRIDDYMGRLILNSETLKATHSLAKYHFNDMQVTKKFSTAILKTYFGKIDACIVPSYAFNIVTEMNPDIFKKLTIIYKSEKIFLPMIAGFHNKTDNEIIRRFKINVVRFDQTVRGQNILNLFKMKQVFPLEKKNLLPLLTYYSEYIAMKKQYGIKDEE